MSKSKEKLKQLDEEIEKRKQKELARMQLEAAREIALKGFSRYGVRDFFENKIVRAGLLAVITFISIYFGFGLLLHSTRSFGIEIIFTGTAIQSIPNFVWWIIFVSIIGAEILVPRIYEKIKKDDAVKTSLEEKTTRRDIRLVIMGASFIFLGILFVVLALLAF